MMQEELTKIETLLGAERFKSGYFHRAADIFQHLSTSNQPADFLTLPAYEYLD